MEKRCRAPKRVKPNGHVVRCGRPVHEDTDYCERCGRQIERSQRHNRRAR